MTTTDAALETLFNYLEDEFRNDSRVRVRIKQRAGTQRSIDLVQDYDPEAHSLHTARGVQVRARSREYFFPVEWASGPSRMQLDEQVREIHGFLD